MNGTSLVYGALLIIAGVCATFVTRYNKNKKRGTGLTTIIALMGYTIGIVELIMGVM